MTNSNSRPGDIFIERYMPGASEEEREAARGRLRAFVAVLVRIDERVSREKRMAQIREEMEDAVESDTRV